MRHQVLDYQKSGIMDIEDFDGRALLSAQMGLGKTLMAAHVLRRNPSYLPAVIIAPASVKYQWEHELQSQISLRAAVLEGQRPFSTANIRTAEKAVILNYDILPFWIDWLRDLDPRTIIMDEVQYTSNRFANRTKACKAICRGREHVLGLSGTPLVNRPAELWPALNMIRPDVFTSFWSFAQSFCCPRLTPWGWQYKGASNIPDLHRILKRVCMIRLLKADVLSELPDKSRQVVLLPMSDRKEYEMAKTDFLTWLAKEGVGRVTAASRAQVLNQMGYLRRLSAKLKLRAAVDWINQWLAECDEKLVIFTIHKKMTAALVRRLNANAIVIDGDTPTQARKMLVKQFQHDSNIRLAIGNIAAMGVGVDGLQHSSQTAIFAEIAWRPGDHTQAEDRLHRMGQLSRVEAFYLVAHGTIEEKLCEINQEKQAVLSGVLDGGPLNDDLNIFTQLIQEMKAAG